MNELQIIDQRVLLGQEFKIYGDFENPLFLAKDVASWIEHSDTPKMLITIDDEEKLKRIMFVSGQNREMWFLKEDGLYEVLMQSRKPIAKQFKKQVKQILKDIRRTGMYLSPTAMTDPYLMMKIQDLVNCNEQLRVDNKTLLNDVSFIKSQLTKVTPPAKRSIWKSNINEKIRALIENSDLTHNQCLSKIYKQFAIDGCNLNDLKEMYAEEQNLANCSTIDFIDSSRILKSRFENYLTVLFPIKDTTISDLLVDYEKLVFNMNPIKVVMQPLIEKYNDKSIGGSCTYRKVYTSMGINWKNRLTRYKNTNNLKRIPKKIVVIEQNEKLMKLFLVTVGKLLSE